MALKENVTNLRKLLGALKEDHLSGDDFENAFKQVVAYVKKIEAENLKILEQVVKELAAFKAKLESDTSASLTELKGKTNTLFVQDRMSAMEKEISKKCDALEAENKKMCDEMRDFMEKEMKGHTSHMSAELARQMERHMRTMKEKMDTAMPKRLEMSAIKGLKELLELLEEKVNKKVVHVPVGGGGGDTGGMKVYNISSSLNGVLKTFSLPAVAEIFFVLSTSAPSPAMISSEDFTMDFTTMEITFGASIDAATTLAAGQRILVCYA